MMEANRFDAVARALTDRASRRTTLGLTLAAVLGVLRLAGAEAKKKRKKKKRKIQFNDLGCVDVGGGCKSNGQCCSGICAGKKDKQTCQSHDASTCQAGQRESACAAVGDDTSCLSSTGANGLCNTTTGSGAYCAVDIGCFDCTTDADCVPICGPQAACIVCSGCAEVIGPERACAGPAKDSCTFPPL